MQIKKDRLITVCVTLIISIITLLPFGMWIGYKGGLRHKTIIVHTDFDDPELTYTTNIHYDFLPPEISDYICKMSDELGIDSNLVVAILMKENPQFDPKAVHRNKNGTSDCGLMQLNDVSIQSSFIPNYWDLSVEFDPFNWKHNLFLAMHFIQDLTEYLKIEDEVIMAYNAGLPRVMNNEIPVSTFQYLAAVKNNLLLLRETYER